MRVLLVGFNLLPEFIKGFTGFKGLLLISPMTTLLRKTGGTVDMKGKS
jgi:hypothetical protein